MTNVKVCVGTSCHLKGSYNILMCFQQMIEQYGLHDRVKMKAAFCMGECKMGVCVDVNGRIYSVTPDAARTFFKNTILCADGESRRPDAFSI